MYGWIQVGEKNNCVFIGWLLWGWKEKKWEKKWKKSDIKRKEKKIKKLWKRKTKKEYEIMLC